MAPRSKMTKKSLKKSSKKSAKKTEKKEVKKNTKEEPTIVVLFFAHWCGHCQAMYPEWEKLQKELENNDNFILKEIEHGSIEYDKPLLEKEYGMSPIQVQGFPTLAKFHPRQQIEYYEGGERTKENFISWLQKEDIKESLNPYRFYYGGYKIPLIGKVKIYSKSKTSKSKSKSKSNNKSKTAKKLAPLSVYKK